MNGQAEIPLVPDEGFARVKAHTYPQLSALGPRMSSKRPLGRYGSGSGVLRATEDHEEGVALGIDLLAVVLREGGTQESSVIGQNSAVPVAQPPEEPRRSLDVAEEEGNGSARKLGHLT